MASEHQESPKVKYTRLTCLFLAEGLRTRRISIKRSIEIVEKILQNINLIDTEEHFLSLVKELSVDFEELVLLENKANQVKTNENRKKLETLAREYAIKLLTTDPDGSLNLLQDAAKDNATLPTLEAKYPNFSNYVKNNAINNV